MRLPRPASVTIQTRMALSLLMDAAVALAVIVGIVLPLVQWLFSDVAAP